MTISRREFLPMAIMTPLAAKLMANPIKPQGPIAILESTAKGRKDYISWYNAKEDCDRWVRKYAHMFFTGFKQSQNDPRLAGQFLWLGVATFRSGRKETIYYYVNMMIAPEEIWNPPALSPHIDQCLDMVKEFKNQFAKDGTICTIYHSRRRVASVEWYDDQRYSGVPVPAYFPDPRKAHRQLKSLIDGDGL